MSNSNGPLAGLRIIEFAGLGPVPFACMLLADMGADVVTVERPGAGAADARNIVGRNRSRVVIDLKDPDQISRLRRLIGKSDVLVEGFRPGVMERLGLGPNVLCEAHPYLIYGRMTGWGQTGPLAQCAGHDLNYIALSGALAAIGTSTPVPPLNLIGDYGAGSMYLVSGVLAALFERHKSGIGQVIDAAITDGTFSIMSTHWSHLQRGLAIEHRESNMLDGGAPYYRAYQTSDGSFISVAAIEEPFFRQLCELIAVPPELRDAQHDRERWPELARVLAAIFVSQPVKFWVDLLEGTDCCFAPVLALSDAKQHPHNRARSAFVNFEGVDHPAPAPRFSRTPSTVRHADAPPLDLESIEARWPDTDQSDLKTAHSHSV